MADNKTEDKAPYRISRQTIETLLWLLVIIGLLVLVLQAMGYLSWFQLLQGKAAAFGLAVIGIALAAGAVYSYLQGLKLKETIKRLTEQQSRRFRTVTLVSDDPAEQNQQPDEEEQIWQEKVKFTAVIEERQRLARELHDAVSQQLFAISMTATAVGRTIDKDFERARRQVELIEEMASVAQSEMRALLLHLRPIHLDGKNLAQALGSLLDELRQKVPMDIKLDMDPGITLMPDAEDHLFRIFQESLSNTLRHAKATAMEIRLFRYGKQIHLTLRDNGVGFDLEAKKQTSYGLLTMEERVHEMGGTMKLQSAPGEGTTIEIWIPALTDERGSE
ncbi:sensor histidine kinase [Paenibacillus sp. GCM10012307]|uniref:Oxygen sensor histidine kinase NreB n=1 Tax=Paenibacillus roseus TaxID=2798579 RepID=A0A934J4J2_9BACL|nr:sensor histidine kinase [Paenibacillus roseus]MBJ6360202.1 sensor histidine kinase [Paenibacillus roseus]